MTRFLDSATITLGSVSAGITAAVAILAFIVGGIVRPRSREVLARRKEAEALAIAQALRNQEIDERIARLLTMSEAHERRIVSLEHTRMREHPESAE